ncbi:uncharacterized protein LOC113522791 [Galleria mellonella]|uniref:Uncharacterized protein LOC113522791 n=1 Tax=Galleria mellonella TaxID=7137 RepID=A0A6J1X938_GALME|nr:uncharacterized protein LOC113522791 [Galleria mellonella]
MNCMRLFKSIYHWPYRVPIAKYIGQHPFKFLETQDKWRESDGVSKRWHLIYKAPMEKALNYLTVYLTFSTSTVACGGLYYAAFEFDLQNLNNPVILGEDVVIADSPIECLVYVGAFVLFHAAVKMLLAKYVVRMYQDGDNYLAVFRGNFFNSVKKHQFHLNDFKKLNPTIVVSWGDARFDIGNKHAIILENYFKTPEHFNYLLNKKGVYNPKDND